MLTWLQIRLVVSDNNLVWKNNNRCSLTKFVAFFLYIDPLLQFIAFMQLLLGSYNDFECTFESYCLLCWWNF